MDGFRKTWDEIGAHNRCGECGALLINNCPYCGAPQCCPSCCKITRLETEAIQLKTDVERMTNCAEHNMLQVQKEKMFIHTRKV